MQYIACFGDSLIQGFPFAKKYSWITAAETANKTFKTINYGLCGDCCDDILFRIRQYPLPAYVKHILFLGGANDILQGKKYDVILDDYRKLLTWCQEKDYHLCVVLPLISADTNLNKYLLQLRQDLQFYFQNQVFILDLQPAIGSNIAQLKTAYVDGLHPTAQTYGKLGIYAAPFLEKWLQEHKNAD